MDGEDGSAWPSKVIPNAVAFPCCFGDGFFLFHFNAPGAVVGGQKLHLGVYWANSTGTSVLLGYIFALSSRGKAISYVVIPSSQGPVGGAAFANAHGLNHLQPFLHLSRSQLHWFRHFRQPFPQLVLCVPFWIRTVEVFKCMWLWHNSNISLNIWKSQRRFLVMGTRKYSFLSQQLYSFLKVVARASRHQHASEFPLMALPNWILFQAIMPWSAFEFNYLLWEASRYRCSCLWLVLLKLKKWKLRNDQKE